MVRIRTLLILFIAVSGILATIAFIGCNQLQPPGPPAPRSAEEIWKEVGIECPSGIPEDLWNLTLQLRDANFSVQLVRTFNLSEEDYVEVANFKSFVSLAKKIEPKIIYLTEPKRIFWFCDTDDSQGICIGYIQKERSEGE